MGKPLVVELSENTYAALQQKATKVGLSPAGLVANSLEQQFGKRSTAPSTDTEARARFERHFGSVDIGRPTGADNESIENDLAKEYAADSEQG